MSLDTTTTSSEGPRALAGPVIPAAAAVLLLVLATALHGAFTVNRWAPASLFALVILVPIVARRGWPVRQPAAIWAAVLLWALVAWQALSALWAYSPAEAVEGALRTALYAAVFSLALTLGGNVRALRALGAALVGGIGVIGFVGAVHMLLDGPSMFLAGRLDWPIGYRNATAALFAMAFWPMIIEAAPRGRSRFLRAVLLGLATLMLALAFMTQSRGILLGLLFGGVPVIAAGPDRLRRVWLALTSLGIVALCAHGLLAPYRAFDGGKGTVTDASISQAADWLWIALIVATVAGVALALLDNGLRVDRPDLQWPRRLATAGLGALAALVLVGGLAYTGNPITFAHKKYDEFTNLNASTTSGSTRLTSVSGQRYDLWRVGFKAFEDHPVGGIGQDNYPTTYYRERATDRNLNNPHSIVVGLLAETGLVGLLLGLGFIVAVIVALHRGWRTAPVGVRRWSVGLASMGTVLFAQSLVDWMWLIPGLFAIAVFSLGLSVAAVDDAGEAAPRPLGRPWRVAGTLGVVVVALATLAIYLSDAYVQRARAYARASPQEELSAARTASGLDPFSITPHYLQAAALESMGRNAAARAQLLKALDLEPQNFATLGVLGDFEARHGNVTLSRRYYRRALALNPRDTGLQQLARR